MSEEIEKKYLVFAEKLPELKNGTLYIQGYLCLDPHIRFRIIKNEVVITIKKIEKDGFERKEWEFSKKMNKEEIEELISLAKWKPVKKIRYKIKYKGLVWEVDKYLEKNKGLVTVDIELPFKDYKISFPEWVNNSNEITNNPKYFNRNLGKL